MRTYGRRRSWWLFSCILAWALCYPLTGPWVALAGVVVPAAVFIRFQPLHERALPKGRSGGPQLIVVWHNVMDPQRLLFIVTAGVLVSGSLWLTRPDTGRLLLWLVQTAILFSLLYWTGIVVRVPAGRVWSPVGPSPAKRPELFITCCAMAGALVYGVAAWLLQYVTVPLGRRTRSFIPEFRRLEDFYRFVGEQIAGSPFGVSSDRLYWPFLAAGAGLIAGGVAAAGREIVLRAELSGKIFDELAEAREQGPSSAGTGNVFVSYSRRDSAFAERLHQQLSGRLREVWVDWLDIEPSARWRERIDEAIRGSDAVIVLLSRDSLRSKYCWLECERALALRKRVLPVVIDPSLEQGASAALRENGWEPLADFQLLRMSRPEEFATGVNDIYSFVKDRHRWVAFHTRISLRAHEWRSSGGSGALLLRGHELVVAEAWWRLAPGKENDRVALTDEQVAFLQASRAAARRRGMRMRVGAVAVSVALAALAGLVVSGESSAVAQRRSADSRRLAAAADERADGDVRQATLLSVAAFSQADTTEARESMVRQLTRFDKVRGVVPAKRALVSSLALSQDESVLVVWREDETAEVWDTATMRSRGTVRGTRMSSAAEGDMSADGRILGVVRKGVVVLVDTRTMREIHQADLRHFGVSGIFGTADLSRDGKTLIVSPSPESKAHDWTPLWDVAAGTVVRQVRGAHVGGGAFGLATEIQDEGDKSLSVGYVASPQRAPLKLPAGRFLGMSESGTPVMINGGTIRALTDTGRTAWTMGKGLTFEDFSRNGRYLVARHSETPGRHDVWDLRTRRRIGRISAPDPGSYGPQVSLSDDGRWVAVAATSFTIYQHTSQYGLYSTSSGRKEADLPGHEIALGARGRLIAGAGSYGTVTLWDRGPRGRFTTRFEAARADGFEAAAASRGDAMVVLTAGGTVRLLRRSDGRLRRTIRPGADAYRIALSPDGALLAVAEVKGVGYERSVYVEVFDTKSGRRLARLEGQGIGSPQVQPTTLLFSPDGKRLYLGEAHGRSVYSWHTGSWRPGHRYGPDYDVGIVEDTALNADGSLLAVGGGQQTVQVWDTRTGRRLARPVPRSVSVAFRPDGLLVLGGVGEGNPALILWDPRSHRALRAAPDAGELTRAVAVSPDGQTVASVTGDGRLLLWDADLERSIQVPGLTLGHGDLVRFTGEGDRLLIERDGELYSLLVGPSRWRAALCSIAGEPMSPAEWQNAAPGERFRRIC
ncbi:toll/interleukin-1 receptor domain-containing protein [Streptomyces sp. NPDC056105]|uniref:toll/interleukin-1 receptor domain-containing protein n=1 Tax=Streptomyces sp. NPDC056105 TaxID=3345714 RepID=UPI0035D8EE8B